MKTIRELEDYYSTVLWSELKILEQQRKQVLKKIYIVVAIITPLAIILALLAHVVHFIFFGIVGCIVATQIISSAYRKNFKSSIIEKIIKAVDGNLQYSPTKYISLDDFTESKIFNLRPNRYKGDDYIQGTIDKTQVRFSELHAAHESGSGKNRNRTPIFNGLFFIADFNKSFKGITVVLPDIAERLFGGIGKMLQSWNKMRGEPIRLEDPEFEKFFAVYGSDQIEARYILSTSLMKRIADFRKKTKKAIYISFVKSKIFVAIPYARRLFEPRIFKTLLDFAPIKQYYEDLGMAVSIAEDLNLNTRIWTKA
ncbi:MAG: DUF3137 domain-containing protein [Candidatus Omnitrophica bacterium]|nr:DUF3137 domain-containing protein [Candidatus Omnitrophota bacterium]